MAALSPAVSDRLRALHNLPTRYEIAITRLDGSRALLCYTPRANRSGMLEALRQRGPAVLGWMAVPDDSLIRWDGKLRRLTLTGAGYVAPTGRTQRDAIMSGDELPYVGCL